MANLVQLRMLENLHGLLLVDKPVGIAFASVVKAVKRKFNLVKVGHGGSLDAMASGLFILLLNDANKYAEQIMGADRSWTGTMRLGVATNTHDIYGTVLAERPPASLEALSARLKEFRGDLFQTEPQFSTIRREASASYDLADTGEHRQFLTHVYRFALSPVAGEAAKVNFELTAGKSLLVRTLVNDLGAAAGCGAALEQLRRIRIGKFDVAQAVPFEQLLNTEIKDFASWVMPLSQALR